MKVISITKFKSSNLSADFNSVSTIEIDDSPFDSGAFGEVYFCNSVNGKPLTVPQVLKIFIDDGSGSSKRGYDTINKLQEQIIVHNTSLKQRNEKPIEQMNALGALPQFSYEGKLYGKNVFGYSANRLHTPEYLLFDKLFNEPDLQKRKELRNNFYNLAVDQRLKFAHDLAEGFKTLQEMSFIYADLNPKNFFVNSLQGKLTIIDYDSGVVTKNPTDEAETFGKLGEWLAPEIQEQLLQNLSGNIKVDLNTDTWAVAIAIHFMLFNFHPLFFLKIRGKKELKNYFSKHKWPEIDTKDSNFREELAGVYETYIKKLNTTIPLSIKNAFAETINNGYFNPNRRLSYKQWLNAIKGLMVAPTINSFDADTDIIIDGTPVKLKWDIDSKAHTILIDNGVGDVTEKTEVTILTSKNIIYTIKAIGHFGSAEKSINIRVFPTPLIESIFVSAPIIREATNLQIQIPKFPKVDISINNIQNGIQLSEQEIHTTLPNFKLTSFDKVELMNQETKTTWNNVITPLFSRFSNINKWVFRKNKIS
jgi:serine/threonine protein kinase